jgi:hypothetical protein
MNMSADAEVVLDSTTAHAPVRTAGETNGGLIANPSVEGG